MERYEGGKRPMRDKGTMMMTTTTNTMKVKQEEDDAAVVDDHDLEDEEIFMVSDDGKKKKVYGRRGGSGGGGGVVSPPCCQAERCSSDLSVAKRYHRRHKVCEFHAKAPVVIVTGLRQRFCQQCSRFHELTEFDDTKRSCRRRLAGHNERRRKNSSSDAQGGEGSSSRKGPTHESQYRPNEERGRFQMRSTC